MSIRDYLKSVPVAAWFVIGAAVVAGIYMLFLMG
jgi:hypothetical protein